MDFIFGTLATDALKLLHHRTLRQGIQHRYALNPAHPRPGMPVTISAWVGTDWDIDQLVCYFSSEHDLPNGSYGQSQNSQVVPFRCVETIWDTLCWGYLSRWEATLPGQPDGTLVRYRIGGWAEGGREMFANFPNALEIAETAAHASFMQKEWTMPSVDSGGSGHVFTYRVNSVPVPEWARSAAIYQLLVDRYYPGDGRSWTQTTELSQPMGGTLDGVRDRLGYLADLGVTCLWLSPTFVSASAHGYDVIDYRRTADHLGGDAALHRLVDAVHARGMRVLLDLPCNHVSHLHPLFTSAASDPHSPYRDWFTFEESDIGYKAFFAVPSMPTINLANPAARDWMLDNARYWLTEFNVDGYRLDYASGPGPDFWAHFRAACKEVRPDSFCFGEVVDAPEAQHAYVGRLDGCLDFFANESMRKTFGWKTLSRVDLERSLQRQRVHFPADFLMPTFLDNHDMNRFLHIAGGDKDALREALAFQFRLPGPPILYYGTEVGLNHSESTRTAGLEVGRVPMVWDERQDRALLMDVAAQVHSRVAQQIAKEEA